MYLNDDQIAPIFLINLLDSQGEILRASFPLPIIYFWGAAPLKCTPPFGLALLFFVWGLRPHAKLLCTILPECNRSIVLYLLRVPHFPLRLLGAPPPQVKPFFYSVNWSTMFDDHNV